MNLPPTQFNLDISQYTMNDLVNMYGLPPSYDLMMLNEQDNRIRADRLSKIRDSSMRDRMALFLTQAKQYLATRCVANGGGDPTFREKVKDFYNTSYDLKPTDIVNPQEHMVQMRRETPYLSSFPSEVFPGVINPLKVRVLRRTLNIDTRFRENYYSTSSTNFSMSLPIDFKKIVSIQLSAIELPRLVYSVSKQYGNSHFTVEINGASAVVSVPDGIYTPTTIITAINTALTNLGGDFAHIKFLANLNSTRDTGTDQTMVGLDNLAIAPAFSLIFQEDIANVPNRGMPLPLKLGWALGFRNGAYVGAQNYVSEGAIDMNGPKYVYLVIDDHNNNVNDGFFSAFSSSMLNKNILARISLGRASNMLDTLSRDNLNLVSQPREYFGPVQIQNMTVQLLDEYGRILNLNNMDYSFALVMKMVYDI